MMNHYVKKDLSPNEAKEFIKKAVGITCRMRIMPSIFCVDTDKIWDEKTISYKVTKQRVNVFGYFYDDEKEIAEKLSESFSLMSSF